MMKARKRRGSASKGLSRPRKKVATKKPTRGYKKARAKKTAAKKTAAKKTAAKKTVAKKTVAKKTIAKKTVAKKTVAKKTVAKKTVAKKTVAKKRTRVVAQRPSLPPMGSNTPDTTAELLLHRAPDRRRLLEVAPPEEVFAPPGPYAGTAPTSASLSLRAEMLARASKVEETIAELPEEVSGIGYDQLPLTAEEIGQLRSILGDIKSMPPAPPPKPSPREEEAATKLRSFAAKITQWGKEKADALATEELKDAAKKLSPKLSRQLVRLAKVLLDWLSSDGASGGGPPPDFPLDSPL